MEIDMEDDDSVILVSGEEHRLEGNEFYKKQNYKAALESYTAAINTESGVALFYSNRSAANLMLFRYQDALNDAEIACDLDNTNVKALIRLCKCYIIMGNIVVAQQVIEKLLQLDPNNKDVADQNNDLLKYKENYTQYQSQTEKCDFRHALHCIDNCIKSAHASLELKLLRVELLIYLKRYIEAKEILEKQLIDDKKGHGSLTTDALFYRGLCFYYMDHMDKAHSHFHQVLKFNPDHKKAQLAYKRCKKLSQLKEDGNRLVRTCQYDSARTVYTEALTVDAGHDLMNAKLYSNRALTLQKLNHFEEAMIDCDKALLLDPNYDKVRTRRVQCMMGLERWQEAVSEATKLNKTHPSDENTRLLKEAQTGMKRSKQMDPYKVLGVPRNASDSDLKKGYRKRALVHHPDRHSNADEATRKAEEQKFKEVNTAYSVLSDPKKKQLYDSGADIDEVLGNGGSGGCRSGGDPYDMFQSYFANGGGHGRPGCPGGSQKFSFHFQ